MTRAARQILGLWAAATRPWWTRERLARVQLARLRRLVRHAAEEVPLYRSRFAALGIGPEDVVTLGDLSALPLLTRQDLVSQPREAVTSERARATAHLTEVRTSGSSGVPLAVTYRREDATELNATWLRPLLAHGVRPWHRRLEITGPHNFPARRPVYARLGLLRRRCVSVFEEPREWLAAAETTRPDYLWGYSGSLSLLARHLLDAGRQLPGLRAVFGVSDLVTPAGRDLVRQAFGRPLVDVYGAAEAGCIAWQCPACDGYHVNADTVIVEVLDGDRPAPEGVAGRVVVTNLVSRAMPFVRYELGDMAAMSPRRPGCGRGLPLLEVVAGRANAFVRLPSGRLLSPMFFFGALRPFENELRAWRVVQEAVDRLTVLVVPAGAGSDAGRLAESLRRRVGEGVHVAAVTLEALPPEPTGKARAVLSHVGSG